ncbi:hypothetical protein FJT64_007466 [Amphibalanus amphitrite]|uniref:Uncharacterized protein n=1 Tax=Amphibalanus amphitrite TaxID=1232801 RepID=A0A6A4VZ39_AMPAM|nr:hypothetical protein FJT64_007631 [Amphibalanus amphitrite]KAF0294939.1 hypothetical protein FJT64_007466 [Amphibalanus amphitrite]
MWRTSRAPTGSSCCTFPVKHQPSFFHIVETQLFWLTGNPQSPQHVFCAERGVGAGVQESACVNIRAIISMHPYRHDLKQC